MSIKSQEQLILEYLQAGNSLTSIQALNLFGCFRLGARIFDLIQQGYPIKSEMVKGDHGKHFSKYYLAEQPAMPQNQAETAQGCEITLKTAENYPKSPEVPKNAKEEQVYFERGKQMVFI